MRKLVILALASILTFAAIAQEAPKPPQPQSQPQSQSPTADQLWNALVQGNKTFVAGKLTFDTLTEERVAMRDSQLPPVTVLSCSDSRVPPELVFNQSLGALFVIRTAGNVADDFGVASVDFAILNGWTRLIVVLAHDNCGAVRASLGGADPSTPQLLELATRIRTSFIGVPYDARNPENVKRAGEMNARGAAAHLLANSRIIRDAVLTEKVKIVSAYYDSSTGLVTLLP